MNCDVARKRIVEADIEELERRSGSELGEHLAHCSRCRAAAERVLEETRELNRSLARVGPRMTVEEAVALATTAAGTSEAARVRRPPAWVRRAWPALPLAAAAALAAILLLRPDGRGGREAGLEPPPPTDETMALTVHAPDDARMVVFETDNRGITVVWFF